MTADESHFYRKLIGLQLDKSISRVVALPVKALKEHAYGLWEPALPS